MTDTTRTSSGRIEAIDVARGCALIAMLIYHFTWDLEFFGFLLPGTAQVGGWRIFARLIASSFLFLVGVSLVLAHGRAIRWPSFRKRMAQVAAGAIVITIATFFLTPQGYVFFGILHLIAVGSLLALPFLRLPFWTSLAAAAIVIALPASFQTELTDTRWLAWVGFSANPPLSNDFVPVFPWFGAILLGVGMAQLVERFGGWSPLRKANPAFERVRPLATLGRHSLLFYLVHQPVSLAIIAVAAFLMPPDQTEAFHLSCRQTCAADREQAFCESYCGCMGERLRADALLERLMRGQMSDADAVRLREAVDICSFDQTPPS